MSRQDDQPMMLYPSQRVPRYCNQRQLPPAMAMPYGPLVNLQKVFQTFLQKLQENSKDMTPEEMMQVYSAAIAQMHLILTEAIAAEQQSMHHVTGQHPTHDARLYRMLPQQLPTEEVFIGGVSLTGGTPN